MVQMSWKFQRLSIIVSVGWLYLERKSESLGEREGVGGGEVEEVKGGNGGEASGVKGGGGYGRRLGNGKDRFRGKNGIRYETLIGEERKGWVKNREMSTQTKGDLEIQDIYPVFRQTTKTKAFCSSVNQNACF